MHYRAGTTLMVADVRSVATEFDCSTPRPLIELEDLEIEPAFWVPLVPTPDGERFLFVEGNLEQTPMLKIHLVLNWRRELENQF